MLPDLLGIMKAVADGSGFRCMGDGFQDYSKAVEVCLTNGRVGGMMIECHKTK